MCVPSLTILKHAAQQDCGGHHFAGVTLGPPDRHLCLLQHHPTLFSSKLLTPKLKKKKNTQFSFTEEMTLFHLKKGHSYSLFAWQNPLTRGL